MRDDFASALVRVDLRRARTGVDNDLRLLETLERTPVSEIAQWDERMLERHGGSLSALSEVTHARRGDGNGALLVDGRPRLPGGRERLDAARQKLLEAARRR